jgi:putative hydroxymethylpyrimidine transport system substrate-binding protein
MHTPTTRLTGALAAVAAAVITLAGCASTPSASTGEAGGSDSISAERCEENAAAGTITFLTGYYYQASASILDTVAAEQLGYFDDLCLDVEIQPGTGDTGQNTQLLASGQVTFTGVAQQEVVSAQDNGIDILGVSAYSNVGLEVLMTRPDIDDLADLDGTILGQKGNLPVGVHAMLVEAGADYDSIEQVVVGYDPTILPRGQVDSLTGFISNEPNLLTAAGEDVTVWRPFDYDVPGSLGALAVNPAFADENPTAVEDFLRAVFHAYDYCVENAQECVGYAAELSGAEYDVDHNVLVWETETAVIAESTEGRALGTLDLANVDALVELLIEYDLLSQPVTPEEARAYFDESFAASLYDGEELIWPAP